MADDPERDLIPMRDIKGSYVPQSVTYTESGEVYGHDRPTTLEKRIAEQLSRNDLEDQLYRLKDENLELKKNSRKQEEQLKKLATKMSRLLNERKKMDMNSSPGRRRDIEMEEAMEELHDKVRSLEKSNVQLREKLLVAKQQVISHTRRPNAYHHISPKVNTGRPRSGISPYIMSTNVRGANAQFSQRNNASAPLPPYVIQLLDEARNELFNLKEVVSTQRNEIDMYEQELEILRERLQMKDTEFDDEINILKSQITEGQRQHVQENLDLIRLHRELKQKNSKIVSLQSHLTDLEEKIRAQRSSYDRLVKELEDKTNNVREEQKKSLDLFTELQKNKAALHNLAELQESFKSLKKENDVLKDTNDKLIKSVLNQERERSNQSVEQTLKERIVQLESSLSNEIKEKSMLQEEMKCEKQKYQDLNEVYIKLQNDFTDVQKQAEELESKMNILKEGDVDFEELGEALALIKLKKQRSININFLGSISDQEGDDDLRSKLKKSEKDHSDTIKELCSVREMLMTQYKINKDAQDELRTLSEKYSQQEKEYKAKLEEYAHLLDIRAAKIQKLERQLNDVAYGTKKFKIEEFHEGGETIETLELGRGENIFEMHIIKFVYSDDGLKALKNNNPSSFMTWNFYEFELQSTPVVKGTNPQFGCSSQYRVKVDDFFLFYLHKNSTTLELHESLGTDYRTLATCQLNFSEVLEKPHGRLHGSQYLISTNETAKGVVFGTVDFWVKLHVPIEEAFKLYKQKFKALKYIQSNQIASTTATKLLNQPLERDTLVNDLHIKIRRCNNLKSKSEKIQPSAFCVYKFYNLPDQDTVIVPTSNNPEFSYHQTFSICTDDDLEKYLRTQNLEIYVFDDNDPDMTTYIGRASVSLLPLSQGKHIKGVFELTKDAKESCGSIEVMLYWQHAYHAVTPPVSLLSQLEEPIEYPLHIAPVTPVLTDGELSKDSDNGVSVEPPSKPVRAPKTHIPIGKPIRTSTPIKSLSSSSSTSNSPTEVAKQNHFAASGTSSPSTSPLHGASNSKPQGNSMVDFAAYNQTPKKNVESEASRANGANAVAKESTLKLYEDTPIYKNYEMKYNSKDDDTVSEKRQEISFEEMSDEDKQVLSGSSSSAESEHEAKVSTSSHSNATETVTIPSIVIGIHQLALEPDSSVLNDSSIQMLYVEFKFLDYPLEELETPYSLPKPIPPNFLTFDYKKVFQFHPEENLDKYKLLAQMFDPDTPESSWIKFTVVSEPPSEDEGLECEDVGYAYVDLREIVKSGRDMTEENIIIYDAKNAETEIGKLTITVEALGVLQLL